MKKPIAPLTNKGPIDIVDGIKFYNLNQRLKPAIFDKLPPRTKWVVYHWTGYPYFNGYAICYDDVNHWICDFGDYEETPTGGETMGTTFRVLTEEISILSAVLDECKTLEA